MTSPSGIVLRRSFLLKSATLLMRYYPSANALEKRSRPRSEMSGTTSTGKQGNQESFFSRLLRVWVSSKASRSDPTNKNLTIFFLLDRVVRRTCRKNLKKLIREKISATFNYPLRAFVCSH